MQPFIRPRNDNHMVLGVNSLSRLLMCFVSSASVFSFLYWLCLIASMFGSLFVLLFGFLVFLYCGVFLC